MPAPLAAYREFAGIRNTIPVERLDPKDLDDAVNVDIDDTGRASLRPGRTVNVAGAAHSVWSPPDGSEPCLFVQSGALKRLASNLTTVSTLASGLSERRMRYVKVNDRVYHTNGAATGVMDLATGRVRAWGMAIPALPTIGVTIGSLAEGTYLYTMTTLTDGRESGANLARRVMLQDGAGITFTWGDVDGEDVAIYVTEPNGETLYRAAVVPASDGSYTWTGGVLALPLTTQFLDPPPPGQAITAGNGVILIGQGPNVFATKPLAYELCDFRDYLAIDGSEVTFLAMLEDGCFAGTQRACYYLQGRSPSEMSPKVVVAAPGVADSAVVVDVAQVFGKGQGRAVIFVTGLGVYAGFSDGTVQNLTQERYVFDAPAATAATVRSDDTLAQFIFTTE